MRVLFEDVPYAVRVLVRNPLFTLTALLALSLGIGVNSAIFSVVDSVLLRPLPYPEPDELDYLWMRNTGQNQPRLSWSAPDFLDVKAQAASYRGVTATRNYPATVTRNGDASRASTMLCYANYFSVMGERAMIGSLFDESHGRAGNHNVAVLSHGYWQRQFGGNPSVLNETIVIDGEMHRILGVLAPNRGDDRQHELFLPYVFGAAELETRGGRYLYVIGRRKAGVSPAAVAAELAALSSRLEAADPRANKGNTIFAVPMTEEVTGASRQTLLVLLASVGLVLLVTCANISGLLLARAAGRGKEVAIRTALGGGGWRLIRQFLTESLVLSLAGGALALAVSHACLVTLKAFAGNSLPRLEQAAIDPRVTGVTLLLAVVSGLLFGSIPAWTTLRINIVGALREESRGSSAGVGKSRVRAALIAGEVALATILLCCAGLLVRTMERLGRIPLGFQPDTVWTMRTTLPEARYPDDAARARYVERILAELSSTRGVSAAGATTSLPLMGVNWKATSVLRNEKVMFSYNSITPGYFPALGVKMMQGRDFTARDTAASAKVAIINQTFAKRYFADENPLGKPLRFTVSKFDYEAEIVGVAPDLKHLKLNEEVLPMLFQPHAQLAWPYLAFAVRSSLTPGEIRQVFARVDPQQPVDRVLPLQRLVDNVTAEQRLARNLLLSFAGLALLLAAIGLYGLIAYTVAQRTREMGIRAALGASRGQLLGLVLKQGLLLTVTGLAAGLLVAPLASRNMQPLLYEISPFDPLTFGAVAAGLLLIAVVASLAPSLQAARVDPQAALRSE